MVNYDNSIIYKICCRDTTIKQIYIGSTTNFRTRKHSHKSACNNINDKNCNLNVYKFIRDNGNWKNWDMVQVEKYVCDDKHSLHQRERYYIDKLDAKLNKQIPTRTPKQYRIDNKEKRNQYRIDNKENKKKIDKIYNENNKEKIREIKRKYRVNNIDKIKENDKKYRVNNIDKLNEYNKLYKENNIDKLKEKFNCISCGGKYTYGGKKRHEKSKKHNNISH